MPLRAGSPISVFPISTFCFLFSVFCFSFVRPNQSGYSCAVPGQPAKTEFCAEHQTTASLLFLVALLIQPERGDGEQLGLCFVFWKLQLFGQWRAAKRFDQQQQRSSQGNSVDFKQSRQV